MQALRDVLDAELGAPLNLLARDASQRIGWLPAFTAPHLEAIDLGAPVELSQPIKLLVVRPCSGTLLASSGDPVPDAIVEVAWLIPRGFAEYRSSRQRRVFLVDDALGTPAELQKMWTVRTDASGRFELPGIPDRGTIMAAVTAGTYGQFLLTWGLDNEPRLQLPATGLLRGRLETTADQVVIRSVEIVLTRAAFDFAADSRFLLDYERTVAPNADGSFEANGVFSGDYALDVRLANRSGWYADPLPRVSVGPQPEPPLVTVPLRKAAEVRGRVVDAKTGRGIGGVSLVILGRQGRRYVRSVKTDADGNYVSHAPPGSMAISIPIREAPRGYRITAGTRATFSVAEDQRQVTVPGMSLEPAAQVEILVVDRDGKPQPQAEIHRVAPLAFGFRAPESVHADDRGRALFEGLDPEDTLPICVRTNEAVSDGADVIDLGKGTGPVRVTVTKKNAFSLTGVVHDDCGRPLPGATLALEWHRETATKRFPGVHSYTVLARYTTDAGGKFFVPALWPGDRYRLRISAKGYSAAETGLIPGVAGKTHDFASIALRAIEGAVVP